MMPVQLRDGLHFCVCLGRVVVLDLAADRYFQLPDEAGRALQRLVGSVAQGEENQADRLQLFQIGLLVESSSGKRVDGACDTVPPSIELVAGGARHSRRDMLLVLVQQCRAMLDLRVRRFSAVIGSLEQAEATQCDLDEEQLSRLASAFEASLRILSGSDRCLARSIAFKRLCNALHIRATFVIGISLDPFAAHCWVQQGERVLNDSLERVRAFTPIYAA